jgi:hypothetical protein
MAYSISPNRGFSPRFVPIPVTEPFVPYVEPPGPPGRDILNLKVRFCNTRPGSLDICVFLLSRTWNLDYDQLVIPIKTEVAVTLVTRVTGCTRCYGIWIVLMEDRSGSRRVYND